MGERSRPICTGKGGVEMRRELYIPDSELEVIRKINSLGRGKVSGYIVGLIKKDILGSSEITREEVIALILQYCGQNKNTVQTSLDIDLENSIQSVFNALG